MQSAKTGVWRGKARVHVEPVVERDGGILVTCHHGQTRLARFRIGGHARVVSGHVRGRRVAYPEQVYALLVGELLGQATLLQQLAIDVHVEVG